jgi:hypothetical protein
MRQLRCSKGKTTYEQGREESGKGEEIKGRGKGKETEREMKEKRTEEEKG